MRNYYLVPMGALLCITAVVAAPAEPDLVGKWVGQFRGVQIEIPAERGPFGYARDEAPAVQPPRFVDKPLHFEIESQSKGLASGTWISAEFKKRFVCAQTSTLIWNCIDAGGRATLEVTSPSELKVCYFDNREGAQGAGCAILKKS